MATQPEPTRRNAKDLLGEPGLRRALEDYVRRRVPASDVDDVVQTVLCDALASEARPSDGDELKKWLLGIARHKVADHHRRAAREPAAELPEIEAHPPPIEARSLALWAEEQAASTSEAKKTLAWMAREGEGEKLENIAAEENVPAARVRQRVSRMRRWMKERWMAELAAVALLSVLALVAWRVLRRPGEVPEAKPERLEPLPPFAPEVPPVLERARALRADAAKQCDRADWQGCLDALNEAARLDPAGDREQAVTEMRSRAARELAPPPPKSKEEKELSPPPIAPKSDVDEKNISPKPPPTSMSTPTSAPPPPTFQVKPPAPTTPTKAAPKPEGGKKSSKSGFDMDSLK